MRHIHVEDGLRLRFTGRSEEFDDGVEIGLLAAKLALGPPEFTQLIANRTLEQAQSLALKMGYRFHIVWADEDWTEVIFLTGCRRPKLTLVHSVPALRA